MLHQFYISSTALSAYQRMMMDISNNVSNAQTIAFKRSRVELESLFSGMLENSMQDYGTDELYDTSGGKMKRVDYGMGVKVADVRKDFQQGQIQISNNPMDIAIKGDGFFQFRLKDGSIAYGRAGNFQKDVNGYLVDPNGNQLEPQIRIPSDATSITINGDGKVFVQTKDTVNSQELGQMTLAKFENPSGLESIGQNLYTQTELSGQPLVEIPGAPGMGTVNQFALEFSNVNVIEELMKMVITQRSFEMASKAIQSGEQMLRAAEEIAKGG